MMLNPRTRLSSTPRLFLDGYRIGVRSHNDFVNATLYVRGDTALNGVCHAHRLKSTLPAIFQSDEHMKKDFVRIQNPFYAMNRINGHGFLYKDGDIPSLGFKAQEIEQIFPFLVEETNGIKYVSYSPLIAVNWEATKELKQKLDALSGQVKQLKQKMDRNNKKPSLRHVHGTHIGNSRVWLKSMFHSPKRPKRRLNRDVIKTKVV